MRPREDESTKQRLLAAARDHYLEVGIERFSLREVARRCGVSAPAVYRHFDGKDALLRAVCDEGFRVFASYLLESLRQPKPLERLRASGRQYLRFALERPHDYRVIFMSDVASSAVASPRDVDPSFQFLVDRVRECVAAKDFRRADPEEVAVTIWAHVHGLASLRLAGHLASAGDDEAFAAMFARSVDRLLAGLSA
jgi:AcrR family transcriptional regulator